MLPFWKPCLPSNHINIVLLRPTMANARPPVTAALHHRVDSPFGLHLGHLKVEQLRQATLQLSFHLGPPCSQRFALEIKALIRMSLPARRIAELSLRIVIRQTNRGHLGQVTSEARQARRNAPLYLLQSRQLPLRTLGRRPLQSTPPCLFLHHMPADLLAMLDPLLPLPWMLRL